MKKSILTLLFALITTFSFSQENDSYKSTLKKLIQVSGSEVAYINALNQMFNLLKQQQPNVPDAFWDELVVELNKDAINQLVNMISPIYKKHLTEADIRGVIVFYETPVGKKFAEKTPFITQESMVSAQEWGIKIGERVAEKLKAKGY